MIRILEDRVVNKIAAGEVVERPASVIKELVENSLDAGATDLRIELKGGGRNLIRVEDNGCGMDRSDATLCLERHATSKIRSEDDLFQIATLGFRGEAIPSIAAVSRFELLTRPHDAPEGTRVMVEGGRLVDVQSAGCPPGTRILIRSLFYNVPVRRKFLRTEATELSHCLEAVVRQALIRPGLDLEVTHDGQRAIRAPVVASLADRAADLLGPHGAALVPAAFTQGELSVEGLISPVGVHRASANGSTYLYVNGRFVRDNLLRRALQEAYRGIVPKDRYPTVVLQVTIPPDHVDVNVHPAKTEVRFRHGHDLARVLAQGLREALQRHGIKQPVAVESRYQPADLGPEPQQGSLGLSPGLTAERAPPPWPSAERPAPSSTSGSSTSGGGPVSIGQLPSWNSPSSWTSAQTLAEPMPLEPLRPAPLPPPRADGASRDLLPVPRFSDLRVIGQLGLTYVLCEGAGELVIIDQHAAHERITLYKLTQAPGSQLGGAQRLLTPEIIDLTPSRAAALVPHTPFLARYGLEIEPFGGASVAVQQIPEALQSVDVRRLVEDVADDLVGGGDGEPARAVVEKILATMACHNSIRAGRSLSTYEMRHLLSALDQVDFSVCAHGRPVSIRVTPAELERRFHRT